MIIVGKIFSCNRDIRELNLLRGDVGIVIRDINAQDFECLINGEFKYLWIQEMTYIR